MTTETEQPKNNRATVNVACPCPKCGTNVDVQFNVDLAFSANVIVPTPEPAVVEVPATVVKAKKPKLPKKVVSTGEKQ